MATFDYAPDYSSPLTDEFDTEGADFGGGYSQRTASGINPVSRRWRLIFTRSKTEITAIRDFLRAREGWESFHWTPPGYTVGKWYCPKLVTTELDSGTVRLTAEFLETFGD